MIRGMLPAQRVVACLKFDAFCKMHRRRVCSLLRAKREPERTAVPAGHESPSGSFKPQTGLRSKYRAFSAARSPLLSRRGRRRVAAPCVCFVPWTALAFCRPLPQQLLPASAAGRSRRRCNIRGKIIFYRKKARKSADFLAFTFHGEGRGDKRHLAAVGLRPSRSGKDAFDQYGPIGEKAVPKRPQSFRNCKL